MWMFNSRGGLNKIFMVSLLAALTLTLTPLFACTYVSGSRKSNFGCLNHEGEFVDWWVIYKETGGVRYIYTDSRTVLHLNSSRHINKRESPLVRTVLSSGFRSLGYFANSPFYTAWNDQPLKSVNAPSESAHSKVIFTRLL